MSSFIGGIQAAAAVCFVVFLFKMIKYMMTIRKKTECVSGENVTKWIAVIRWSTKTERCQKDVVCDSFRQAIFCGMKDAFSSAAMYFPFTAIMFIVALIKSD